MMWFDWMILRSSLIARMSRYSIPGDKINEIEKEIEVCSCALLKFICYCSLTLSMVPKLRSWTKGLKQGLWKVQPTIALLVTEVSRVTISSAVSHARSVYHFSQLHSQPLRLQFSPTFHSTWLITTQSFAKWDISRANLLHGFALSYLSFSTKGHKPSYWCVCGAASCIGRGSPATPLQLGGQTHEHWAYALIIWCLNFEFCIGYGTLNQWLVMKKWFCFR